MKRFLVNDRILSVARTGVGQYLASVVAHWPDHPQVELVGFYFRKLKHREIPATRFHFPALAQVPAIKLRSLTQVGPGRASRWRQLLGWLRPPRESYYWMRVQRERRHGVYAGFFEPNHLIVADVRPIVASVMDLSVLECPQYHPADRVAFWKRHLDDGLRWTGHWICISQATAKAMQRVLGVSPHAQTVIPLASRWGTPPTDWTPETARRRLRLPPRYLLYMGTIEPRKNILRILDAYAARSRTWREHTPLLLAGMPGWGDAVFWRSLREHPMAAHAFTTGYLTDAQAAATVFGASALVYPSLYEGFGLPPLEAMVLGVPVAASTAESVREVCADAAVCLDPEHTQAWGDWLEKLSEPGDQRQALIARGLKRAKDFSWELTAQAHHDLLLRLAA